jgi:outer membrane protein assembly factor BamB
MTLEPIPETPGLWPVLRRDERLSGHQDLRGSITRPAIAWRHYLGGPLFDARTIAHERGADLVIPFGGCLHRYDASGTLVWKSAAHGIESIVGIDDIDADGSIEIVASNGKSVFVFAAGDGRELWREYLGPPFAGGFMHTAARLHHFDWFGAGMQLAIGLLSSKHVALYDFSEGATRPVRRHLLWMDDFFHPSIIAADLDGDGRDELVVTKLSAVYAFDPVSGARTAECHWSSGGTPKRNYGLLEAVDVDRDGALDLVVISDRVSRHIAVVGNDGRGGLADRWDRFIEHIYETDERELRFCASSVVDIDLDGRPEIVVSIFNEAGDGRWWLEVIDATDGSTKCRHPDAYLQGVVRDAPGRPQVLVSYERTRVCAQRARIAAMAWSDGALCERWSLDDAAFVGRFAESTPARALFRTDLPSADDVWLAWVDGEPVLPVLVDTGLALLSAVDAAPELRAIAGTSDVVSVVCVADLDGDDRDEIVVSDRRGLVSIVQADGTAIGSIRVGMRLRPGSGPYYMAKPMSTPVITADASGRYCAVPDGGAGVHVLAWDRARSRPRPVASVAMRGRTGPEEAYHAVSWVMIDGEPVIIGATLGGRDASLAAVAVDGREVARWSVPELPGSVETPSARVGLYDWGIVRADGRTSIVAAGFRSPSMNSELALAIDAESGDVLWRLGGIPVPGHVLAGAPWSAHSVERRDDGIRLHFLAKDTLVAVDVASGAIVLGPLNLRQFNAGDMARRGLRMDDFSAYGSVIPVDVDGDGATERVLIANYGGHGVIDEHGSALWWRSFPLSGLTGGFGGLADIDGDGRLELGVSDAAGDFICIDAATGVERWRMHIGEYAAGVVTCDVDGDGRTEFVLATREGSVVAIGAADNGSGVVKWRIDLGYSLGPPIIADFDGDGASEILVVCGDGYLYSITDLVAHA